MTTLREDKKELQKQFGCMNGIFQLFDRRYLLGLHRHGRNQKKLTSGEGENGKKDFKNSSEKVKEKNIESSRNSCSSSCSSSGRLKAEFQNDIRDVVKNSMLTRTIHVATVRNDQKHIHIDSPRPFKKPVEYDKKDKNNISRFSCDERESKYSLKSTLKVKEVARFSLDSKRNSENTLEPGSNKRPSSGVVARLMGLEGFTYTDSIVEVETLKIKKPFLDHEFPIRVKGSFSVYGEMEKRLSGIEFKASGKDLRALKQILEAIKNKEQSLDSQKTVKPVNREVKRVALTKVNRGQNRKELSGLKKVKDSSVMKKKVTMSCSKSPEKLTGEKPVLKKSKKGSTELNRVKKISNSRNPKRNPINRRKNNEDSCIETRNDQPKEDHKNDFVGSLVEEKPMVEQPSPVSVLDAFYSEDTPSPVKKKHTAFNDYETSDFIEDHEKEWNYCEFKLKDLNSTNEDHKYINQILLASGFLKDLDSAIRLVQIHPTGNLIKPDLFDFLEEKRNNNIKDNQISKRKLIFDFVNDILLRKLTDFGMWSGKRTTLNGEKLMKELCLEMDNVQNAPERSCVHDEDDEVKDLVSLDVNKSEDWDKCCNYEVPGVVLEIERLIFKDLIDEVVNAEVALESRSAR